MTLAYYQPASYTPDVAPRPTVTTDPVAVVLSPHMRARLEDALPPYLVRDIADLADIGATPRRLCIDPSLVRRDPVLYGLVAQYVAREVPLVLYCALTSDAIRDASLLLSFGADRLLLFDIDDTSARLASLGDEVRHARITRDLMRALAPWMERLPLGMRETAESVIDAPERFFDAEDVASRARMSRRHVDRLFALHGLAPAKHLVVACRAYVAVRLLATNASSINNAAELVGYDGHRGIRRHAETIWGLSPRAASRLPGPVLVRAVVDFTTRNRPARG